MAENAFSALLALDAAARAHAARNALDAPLAASVTRAVIVQVAGHVLQVPLTQVGEVKRCPPLASVPGARPWLAGATAWQGRAVAVVDLARLAFDTDALSGDTLLLCAVGDTVVGLQVDAVLETATLEDHVPPTPSRWLGDVDGQGRRHLDLPALLADELLWQAGRWPRARRPAPAAAMMEHGDDR